MERNNFNKLDFAQHLADYHDFFRLFVDYGDIVFTDKIPTAAVGFNRDGNCISFMFNPEFWDSLDTKGKVFIVCHEILHIFYNHGKVWSKVINKTHANIAADLVVNHNLETYFGQDRTNMGDWEKYCWIETIFKDRTDVKANETFHYYYNLLPPVDLSKIQFTIVEGDHGAFGDIPEDFVRQIIESNGEIMEDFLEKYPEMGKLAGDTSTLIKKDYKSAQRKQYKAWLDVIPRWTRMKEESKYKEDWRKPDNRYVDYLSMKENSNQFLPSFPMEEAKAKILLWVFLDSSGSCINFASIFTDAAKSIPKKYFDFKFFAHDTSVIPIDVDKEIACGGGTSYACIEAYIQKHKGSKYPDGIFLLTDNCGDFVSPESPSAWHVFTVNDDVTYGQECFAKGVYFHKLSDFFPLDKTKL